MTVNVLTPRFKDGIFPYRDKIVSRISLTGAAVPPDFRSVLLGPEPCSTSQFVLWCHATCSPCASSPHPQCHPIEFGLDPDRDQYDGFTLDQRGTLTGNVTYVIDHRPRMPKGQDQTWRCASEALM